nr:hypothetical protein [Verrucomicrobiota bacterium]
VADPVTTAIPILYMSGFGADLENASADTPNVIGFLSKPFTSDLLVKAVEEHLPRLQGQEPMDEEDDEPEMGAEFSNVVHAEAEPSFVAPAWNEPAPAFDAQFSAGPAQTNDPAAAESTYFSGDTNFLTLNWALRTIEKEKLTGVLHCYWDRASVELYARDGKVLLTSTKDPDLYCSEAPITLVDVDPAGLENAREQQRRDRTPLFIALANADLILREPASQLVLHYGQQLFAKLWCDGRVRFAFVEDKNLPAFTNGVPEEEVDYWTLNTLRVIQYPDIADKVAYDPNWIPAYTRDGIERVQQLRLTVAEAQFGSQFNGARSIAQIARNLRLDLKFARLTLFRFLALEIVECWPPAAEQPAERGGRFKRLIGLGK